jgi:hypothetical protein
MAPKAKKLSVSEAKAKPSASPVRKRTALSMANGPAASPRKTTPMKVVSPGKSKKTLLSSRKAAAQKAMKSSRSSKAMKAPGPKAKAKAKAKSRAKAPKAKILRKCTICKALVLDRDLSTRFWSQKAKTRICYRCEAGTSSDDEKRDPPPEGELAEEVGSAATPEHTGFFYTPPAGMSDAVFALPTLQREPRQHDHLSYWKSLDDVVRNELTYYAPKLQVHPIEN